MSEDDGSTQSDTSESSSQGTLSSVITQLGAAAVQTVAQLSAAVQQKLVALEQQLQQPTAPQQIIGIEVGPEANEAGVTIIHGGTQQAAVAGTPQSDIIFAAANNATLTGGAGDDILVAGATPVHVADLQALNASGVSGTAILVEDEDMLAVRVDARGLEPGQVHIQDINGRFAGDEFPDAGNGGADVAGPGGPTPIELGASAARSGHGW